MSYFFDSNETIPAGIPLSRLTASITNALVTSPDLSGVWVIAELSDVRISGGHCYMELIEKNETGQTIAKLRATIWRTTYNQLRHKFFSATERDISNGIKALLKGSINHHSIYGISFNIIDIDPSYTIGDLERIRREIIMRLHKEGVAFKNKYIPFPILPQKIAVISAEGAAGYGDFINHLSTNSEGFVFYPFLFPCVMQGEKISESIRKALQLIESTEDLWDCVAIVRGGGATTDLNGFDDYDLAKAVALCRLPVVVGIGHERDKNVLDEIANISLKTPTAVANFFIDKAREAYENIVTLTDNIRIYATDLLRGEERKLSTIQGMIPQLVFRRMNDVKTQLQTINGKLLLLTQNRLEREHIKLESTTTILSNVKNNTIAKENIRISNFINLISNISNNNIERFNQKLISIDSLIEVLDPQNILRRGYSITRINGRAVKSVFSIAEGDLLTTTLPDGEINSIAIQEQEK